jgi:hypothetical protein
MIVISKLRRHRDMPFCPKCRFEYVEGTVSCSDCDGPLVAELPSEEVAETPVLEGEELANVYSAADPVEAQIIKAVLESSGIPVLVRSDVEDLEVYMGSNARGGLVLAVPASKRDEAEEAVRLALEDGKTIEIERTWGEAQAETEEP